MLNSFAICVAWVVVVVERSRGSPLLTIPWAFPLVEGVLPYNYEVYDNGVITHNI